MFEDNKIYKIRSDNPSIGTLIGYNLNKYSSSSFMQGIFLDYNYSNNFHSSYSLDSNVLFKETITYGKEWKHRYINENLIVSINFYDREQDFDFLRKLPIARILDFTIPTKDR